MNDISLGRKPEVLDLFCGAGGLSLGFEKAGYSLLAGVDKYETALGTWSLNHSGKQIHRDLTQIAPESIESKLTSTPDVVIGGPPCKDFSNSNRKVNLGRNNLVLLFSEIVSHFEPEAFVLENVRQLTSKYDGILEDMRSMLCDRYSISCRLLDAADYGVPQHRVRAFVIGIRGDTNPRFPAPTHGPDSDSGRQLVSAGEATQHTSTPDNADKYKSSSKHANLLAEIPEGMNYSFYTEKMGHPNPKFEWRSRFSDYLYKADPNKPVRTIKAKPGAATGPFHWNNRRFTEEELKALQGFPSDFEFMTDSYTHITRMVGNSVPPVQSYAIAAALRRQLNSGVKLLEPDRKLNFISRRRTSSEEYKQKAQAQLADLYD